MTLLTKNRICHGSDGEAFVLDEKKTLLLWQIRPGAIVKECEIIFEIGFHSQGPSSMS